MNNAELYQRSNGQQKRDVQQCLEEYGNKIKWKKYKTTVIDIGCGDGGVTTTTLKNFIPNNCKELLGCDISENMVQFANAHHARDFISFTVLDIQSDLPGQFRDKFDHAFSFNTLHWIKHQTTAFSNIYDLLTKGGDCLLMFLSHMPVYDLWRELARTPRWNHWLKDVEHFVSPYHDCKDPEKNIKIMMATIGFTNVEVKCLQKVYIYTGEDFKNFMNSVNPFRLPLEMQENFLKDYLKMLRDMQLVNHTYNDDGKGSFDVKIIYKHIIAYGKKIAFSNIYNLLGRGGDCLLIFLGHMPVYEVWRKLAHSSRWDHLLRDVDRYVLPYHNCQDPEMDIKKMMTAIGFTNVEVKCLQKVWVYSDFKNSDEL